MGSVAVLDNTYADVVFLSVEVDAGRVGTNAMSIITRPGEFLSCRCKISGDQDWLVILDRGSNATIDQTKIRFAACRGIFANLSFTIKEFKVSNCGGYGIDGQSNSLKFLSVASMALKDGRNGTLLVIILYAAAWPSWHSWGRGYQKSFARDKATAPMLQLS